MQLAKKLELQADHASRLLDARKRHRTTRWAATDNRLENPDDHLLQRSGVAAHGIIPCRADFRAERDRPGGCRFLHLNHGELHHLAGGMRSYLKQGWRGWRCRLAQDGWRFRVHGHSLPDGSVSRQQAAFPPENYGY